MSTRRLYTFDDLYDFFVTQNKNVNFSSEKDHAQIVVQVPGRINFKKDSTKDIEGLLPVTLKACHTKKNLNQSNIDKEVMEAALPSFSNRPILGYIHEVDGEPCFWSHNMHEDEDGEIIYDEQPVGIIRENCNAHLEYDKEADVDRVVVNGYIFEEYSKAAEIMLREETLDVSVELSIRQLSYNAKEKYLNIEDFYFSGVTILQCDDEGKKINPGMSGSDIQLANFSEENSTIKDINDKLDSFFERIANLFNDINNTKEGGKEVTHLEELMQKYNVTIENIGFDHENMTDEELDIKFEELFGENPNEENFNDEPASEGEGSEDFEDAESEENNDAENSEESHEEESLEDESDEEPAEDTVAQNELHNVEFSVTHNGVTKNFSVSLKEKFNALYNLVAETYNEIDCEWYDIDIFEDTKTVEMYGYFTGKNYRQKYKVKNDTYSLVGDRCEIFAKYLSQDEIDAFEKMKADFAALEQYKVNIENQKAHEEREAVMSDDKYSLISNKVEKDGEMVFENEAYAALYAEMDNYSCEELDEKLKAIIGEYALNGGLKFSHEDQEPKVGRVSLPIENKKAGRYGSLFSQK